MENFESLQRIDNFCKVLVKKSEEKSEATKVTEIELSDGSLGRTFLCKPSDGAEIEEPLVDIFEEADHVRILVQCRCREQQVTFHPSTDSITICKEECHREKDGPEVCRDVCRKLNIPTHELQLEYMQFVIAKCNNNNTLEAMIPKMKK